MKSTIQTDAATYRIQATAQGVFLSGLHLDPHMARLLASELDRAAVKADQLQTVARHLAKQEARAA